MIATFKHHVLGVSIVFIKYFMSYKMEIADDIFSQGEVNQKFITNSTGFVGIAKCESHQETVCFMSAMFSLNSQVKLFV